MGKNCVWRTKQQRSTNDIDTSQGTTTFLIYFLTVFMFIKELAFIINSSCCFSDSVDQEPTLKRNIWSEGEKEICHAL